MREQDLEFNPEYKYAKGGKASDETYREVYQHKYIPTMTFEITGETANGYKGIQKDKKSLSKLERTKGKKVSYSSSDLKDLFTKMYAKGGEVDDYIMVNKKDFYNDTWKAVSINNKIKVWNKTYNRKEYDKLLDNESFVFRHLSNTSSSDPTNFKTKKIDGYMRSALYLPKYSFIKSGSAKGFVDVSDLDDILSYAKGGKFAKGGKVSADDFTPYARICDVTGEGMNEGWLMGDSFYVKYEKDLIKELRKDFPNQKDLSDNELMEEAYEEEYYYYTEWEDPSDVEYVEYKGKLYEKDELEDEIPAKDFEVFKGAYGIIFEEDYYAKGGKTKKFPVAVKRRVDEINEMLPKVNESGDYASTYAGSTMESYIILDKPIQIKGNYVYISEKDSRWGKYGFEKRYNVNDTRDVYESIKGRKALMSDLGIIKRAFTKLLKSEGKMAKGGKTKKFPKGFIDYVEESDNVYEDNGLYYNVETQYAKAFTLQELYDWTQKEGYEFAKGGIAKKSEYISNRDIVSLTHKKGGTKKTLKGSQLVDGAYAKKKIMRKKPTKSDQLSLLNKGGDILRAYDVNVNSGVGTYARGGKISKDDAIVKALKMGVDFNKDFHAQSFGGELTELAKETGYRKSKSSSGSTGRAFFEHLERRYDKNPSYYNDMVKSYARGGQTNETINLKSYNLSGKVINSGKFIADYENETITFPSGKTYKVVKDYEWTSKVLKTKIKAIGGIRGFVKFLKEINTPDSPFNPSMTNAYINNGKKARGGKMAVGGKTTMAGDTDFPSQMLNYAKGGTIIKKGNRVRVVNTQYDGKQGLVVSNDLQNGNYQVQIDGKVKGFPFENLMLLSRETYAKGGEVAKYKTGITKYGKNQYAVRVDIGDKDLIPKLLNDRWDSRSKAEAFAKRLAKRNNGTYVGEDGLWAKGGKTKSIMSKKDIGVVIPKTYQIGDKEFGNTYKVERINTKKYSDNDKNRHYNFRIWEYDKSLDLFDEIKSPSAKLKALERIEMSKDYAKGGKFASGGNVSYNGWTNYATWVTNLEILDGMDWKDYNMGEPISAEQIEDYVQEVMEQSPELAVSFANRFLNDVNYYEIVEHINDDFDLDDGEKDEYAKGGDVKNSGYKLAEEEIELIDKFNRVGFDNKVFTHYLTESKNADKETYYNHKVYNPFKDTTEYLGQFRDRGEAIDSFYSYKPKSYAKGGQMKKPMIRYSGRR